MMCGGRDRTYTSKGCPSWENYMWAFDITESKGRNRNVKIRYCRNIMVVMTAWFRPCNAYREVLVNTKTRRVKTKDGARFLYHDCARISKSQCGKLYSLQELSWDESWEPK